MSNKYKEYARSKTSLRGRTIKVEESRNKPIESVRGIVDTAKDSVVSASTQLVNDTAAVIGIKDSNAEAAEHNRETLNRLATSIGRVDSRSQLAAFNTDSSRSGDVFVNRNRGIALLDNLSMINGLPPIPDNVVDPPPIWLKDSLKQDLRSWGNGSGGDAIVGRDYLQRVIARGQFLTLVPLDIVPNITGNIGETVDNVVDKIQINRFFTKAGDNFLKTLDTRLNVASYGLMTKVNSIKYFRAVNAHMKAALLSLGIDIYDEKKINAADGEALKKYLPSQMVDKLIGKDASGLSSVHTQLGGTNSDSKDNTDTNFDPNNNKTYFATRINTASTSTSQEAITKMDHITDIDEHVKTQSYENLLKFITNIDTEDQVIKTLPMVCFYCNGPVERSMGASVSLGESSIAKMTTDIGSKFFDNAGKASDSKIAGLISEGLGAGEDYIKEMAYHRNIGGFLVSNTYIPNVIKQASLDFQYTVNIRDVAVSSDRYSIARLFWTLSQLFPFVIQTNMPSQALVVPSSPMYCSAFIKGIMNLPRAAITSLSIRTNPEFQTTEGIPTELDISITVQPLFSQSTMPNFDKFYNGESDPQYLAAAMYNPLSSFNIIATLAGQNTILTKLQFGIFQFFIRGSMVNFKENLKNTGAVLHSTWQDWWSSEDVMKNSVISRTRLVGNV